MTEPVAIPEPDAETAAEAFRAVVAPQVVRRRDEDDEPGEEDNPEAARVLGKREEDVGDGVLVVNMPCEEGFHCPVCDYPQTVDGEFDERLAWSEYRAMLWCYVCERDYPSALCVLGDPVRATEVFLRSVEGVMAAKVAVADA